MERWLAAEEPDPFLLDIFIAFDWLAKRRKYILYLIIDHVITHMFLVRLLSFLLKKEYYYFITNTYPGSPERGREGLNVQFQFPRSTAGNVYTRGKSK